MRAHGTHVVLEGGAIDVDGEGTLLATEECLLDAVQARNPGCRASELEGVLARASSAPSAWSGSAAASPATTRTATSTTWRASSRRAWSCCARSATRATRTTARLRENRERLRRRARRQGRKLDVIALPMPAPLVFDGRRLPASYANFYIANDVVLVPTFNDPADRVALGILGELFPSRQVVGIHCVDLVWGLGTLHCMTQQEPA